ncbi:ATP-dependent DNA ligase [Luteitalea sp. TBR-22]|uniref:ATP-dependent DNA ligase n=1 Tax=Luteitalea sp. TBR-22 TaxID=2802971 RepID=UPI001AF3A1AE|nr:ATP-dependent DNA ligase [Luteitalea sp. TBR-22]BCS31177.1 ATP-dependent DNA ligase [Luteitalea sp. TBR-22]
MRRFAGLYATLDRTSSTNAKVQALEAYFREAPPEDAAWAVHFLAGRRLLRLLPTKLLREWAMALTGVAPWLLDESYAAVGDLAETLALLLDGVPHDMSEADVPLHVWIEERLEGLRGLGPEAQREAVVGWWRGLPTFERFILNKLLTGEMRVGVSQTLVVRALSDVAGVDTDVMTHRLMGQWAPSAAAFRALLAPEAGGDEPSRPYPFCLAYPLEQDVESLGPREAWQVEWKWDGIRAQLIRRGGRTFLWSRGEEVITARFPEVTAAAEGLPDGHVLDGEVLAWEGEAPLPFARLQLRIGRQTLTRQALTQAPAAFMAYDLLEQGGEDVRARPLDERRARLEAAVARHAPGLKLSPLVAEADWESLGTLRQEARARGVEGYMLKRRDSAYGTGRRKGDWWKWKVDPYSVDAVLVYAQPGNGRRATLFTDYTFALWKDGELVPVAKAYSGLSNEEIEEVDRWVRGHTLEKFGPVRRVAPSLVFEIAFENVQRSTRHKSGVAVRFPRIARWRRDKSPVEADAIDRLTALIK